MHHPVNGTHSSENDSKVKIHAVAREEQLGDKGTKIGEKLAFAIYIDNPNGGILGILAIYTTPEDEFTGWEFEGTDSEGNKPTEDEMQRILDCFASHY